MKFEINNFKCHRSLGVELKPLTVLAGKNGSGKSTVIQALLLNRLACEKSDSDDRVKVALNGPFSLALGLASHLLPNLNDSTTSTNSTVTFGNCVVTLESDEDENSDFVWAHVAPGQKVEGNDQQRERDLPSFVFLSAERLGPRLMQPQKQGHLLTEVGIGPCGENSAEFLRRVQRRKVADELATLNPTEVPWVLKHLEHWLEIIFGGIAVRVVDNGEMAPPSIQFQSGSISNDWLYPTHYGFGVTYALPILLAGLASEAGDVLVVDSPEAHLHPAAQTQMASFLCMLSAAGRTVIVETHSDHIVDGIRLCVASDAYSGRFTSGECQILFFERDAGNASQVSSLEILEDGTLSHWPRGFFDQMSWNLRQLAEAKKKRRGVRAH